MISTKEALERVLAESAKVKLKTVSVPLERSLGTLLKDDLKAKYDSPPFDQSAMDGYAFRMEDIVSGESIYFDAKLENSAGASRISQLAKNTALRIFTGAKIPAHANVVIPQENITVNADGSIHFDRTKVKQLDNIRLKGSQFKKNEIILKKNTEMRAASIALAVSAGYTHINTYAFPIASLLVSGNELVKPGSKLKGDEIHESNSLMLEALLNEWKVPLSRKGRSKDKLKALILEINKCLKTSDLLLISGGISVGKYDLVKEALKKCGVIEVFHKVKQKPGKPLYFGRKGNKFIFGLPGNPAASMTCFYEYVVPLLKVRTGKNSQFSKVRTAPCKNTYSKKAGLTHFLKGRLSGEGLEILGDQESYKLTSFVEANCLIVIPEEMTEVKMGDQLQYHLI